MLRGDREVATAALKQKGTALAFASKELRGDRATVFEAVKSDAMALQHVVSSDKNKKDKANDLRRDRELALAAVTADGMALYFLATGEHGDSLRGARPW